MLINADVAKVYKVTLPNVFGDSYYLVNGRMNQRNCSPLEYLLRLRLWKKLFWSAPTALGIAETGQIVSLQQYVTGKPTTQEAVDKFLQESGLDDVRKQFWLWKKTFEGMEVWVGDTRDDNFVETPAGIVPIDLRVWLTGAPEKPIVDLVPLEMM